MDARDMRWLAAALASTSAVAGTVHRRAGDRLVITAAVEIPPPVVAATREIPRGKGMAGLAWLRGAPVTTCDLQSDTSGDVRPGAKAVGAGQAVAVPVFGDDGALRAVVGFAFAESGEPDAARIAALAAAAATLAG
ncbi:MAG: GAF domain-containing protein [Myxococcales bacterium]|nr:GAF domain-containing protein [Myxococcales bacterium]